MKSFLKHAVLAAAGLALVTQLGHASNLFNQGDLILGLSESGHNDLMIDLGSASTFLNASSTINLDTIVAAAGNSTYTTLSSLIIHNFGSASGISWSVGGADKSGAAVTALYLTNPGDSTTPISQSKLSTAGGTYIGTYANVYSTATSGNTLVANLAVDTAPSVAGTYTKEAPLVDGQTGFNYESVTPSEADLYTFTPGNAGVKANGSFEIDGNGNGSYVVNSVPEPTGISILGVAIATIIILRRKFKNQPA